MGEHFDLWLFHLVNSSSGNPFFDHVAELAEHLSILNGAIALSAYVWLWFEGHATTRERQRVRLIALAVGTLAAIVIARLLAHVLPFRIRPIYSGIGYLPPSIHIYSSYEQWSSFPSDHAAMFFSIAFGVFLLWREAGALLLIFAAVWICLPRVYLGLHYPSDILVGALLGIASAKCCFRLATNHIFYKRVAAPALRLEKQNPALFYSISFFGLIEMAAIFPDVRYLMNNVKFLFQQSAKESALVIIAASFLIVVLVRMLANRSKAAPQVSGNSRTSLKEFTKKVRIFAADGKPPPSRSSTRETTKIH